MNTKRKTILGIIIFVAFIGISYLVYSILSKNYTPNQDEEIIDISSQVSEMDETSSISSEIEDTSSKMNESSPVTSDTKIIPHVNSQMEIKPPSSSQLEIIPRTSSQGKIAPPTSSKAEISPPISSQAPKINMPPDFTVFKSNGTRVKLSDFAGQPIILNFWASWCPPCKREMPIINNQYAISKNSVVFMMVDLVDGQRETQAKGQKYYDSQGYSFPIYFDNEKQAARQYNTSSIPITFFINSNGKIVKTHRGEISKQQLADAIRLIQN